jgi:hypothetical protein
MLHKIHKKETHVVKLTFIITISDILKCIYLFIFILLKLL